MRDRNAILPISSVTACSPSTLPTGLIGPAASAPLPCASNGRPGEGCPEADTTPSARAKSLRSPPCRGSQPQWIPRRDDHAQKFKPTPAGRRAPAKAGASAIAGARHRLRPSCPKRTIHHPRPTRERTKRGGPEEPPHLSSFRPPSLRPGGRGIAERPGRALRLGDRGTDRREGRRLRPLVDPPDLLARDQALDLVARQGFIFEQRAGQRV